MNETAIFAGGCFWGMEELFRRLPGVRDITAGYTGGSSLNPTYEQLDGHAEAIEIKYDPSKISYRKLLEFFFSIHDPTTLNRQGNDTGTSYRSAIYYHSNQEKEEANALIKALNNTGLWKNPIVTEVTKAGVFYPAEGYHQDYLLRNPGGYTCHYVRNNVSAALTQLVKEKL